MQTWKINGQTYTHGQLMELKRQGLNPHKDKIVMSALNPATNRPEMGEDTKTPKNTSSEESAPPKSTGHAPVLPKAKKSGRTLPENFMKLRELARSEGMKVTLSTTKKEIMKFLEK